MPATIVGGKSMQLVDDDGASLGEERAGIDTARIEQPRPASTSHELVDLAGDGQKYLVQLGTRCAEIKKDVTSWPTGTVGERLIVERSR